jgi:hypothetical protein
LILEGASHGRPVETMIGFRGRILGGLLVVALAATSGCQSSSGDPVPTPSVSPSPTRTGELTADEDLAIHPPPPLNLQATEADGQVHLTWQPPPPVRLPHRYSDRVVSYRIYRRGPDEAELRPVGTSTKLTYADRSLPGAGQFAYAVTSIRERGVEGGKSDPAVLVKVP